MPLFYQHNINEQAKLAVWQITEDEDFFLDKIHLNKNIRHPHKKLQHLAGRYLLKILHPEFPLNLIEIAESNKPLLADGSFYFSISHCSNFAAAIISENESAGIDVELVTPKIELIQHKFLSAAEIEIVKNVSNLDNVPISQDQISLLTLCWSCKEAVYKWHGKGGVDFIDHIQITNITITGKRKYIECIFIKDTLKKLIINFNFFDNLCLAWVVGKL